MLIKEAFESISFVGDACYLDANEIDVRHCVAEVVTRLPEGVRDWLLYETTHIFVCMTGTRGQYAPLSVSPLGEKDRDLRVVRMILLGECLHNDSRDDVLHTIAHEIAHSYRNDDFSGADVEEATDVLAAEWGFPTPADRAEVIEGMRRRRE